MKLKDGFITHMTDDEQIIVGTGSVNFSGMVRSNRTAAFIVEQLKQEVSQDQIVDAMFETYDAPKEVIEKDVERILDKLRSIGAIDE